MYVPRTIAEAEARKLFSREIRPAVVGCRATADELQRIDERSRALPPALAVSYLNGEWARLREGRLAARTNGGSA